LEVLCSSNVFSTRKKYENKCKQDGVVTTCRFVCAKQGVRAKHKRGHLTKNARAETRTDCKVCMIVKFDHASFTYKVNDLVLEHNHILQTPETDHMLPSQ
jgi:NAD-dependent dihydropyrimidine dehydrogenase PreA subunit